MNKKQLQIEVCKAMLNPNARIYGGNISADEYAVTIDGFSCLVFTDSEIIFDKTKIVNRDMTKFFEDMVNDVPLKKTKRMFFDRGKTILEYKADTFSIYCNAKLANLFPSDFTFFAYAAQSRILVKDVCGQIVGMFMPLNFHDNEGERE